MIIASWRGGCGRFCKNMLGLGAFTNGVLVIFAWSRPFIFTLGSILGLSGSFLLFFFKENLGSALLLMVSPERDAAGGSSLRGSACPSPAELVTGV